MPLGPLGHQWRLCRFHLANPELEPLVHLVAKLRQHLLFGLSGKVLLPLLLPLDPIGHKAGHLLVGQGARQPDRAGDSVFQRAGQALLHRIEVGRDLLRRHGAGHRLGQCIEIPGVARQLVLAVPGHQPLHFAAEQILLRIGEGKVVIQLPDDGGIEPVVDHPGGAAGQQQADQQQTPGFRLVPAHLVYHLLLQSLPVDGDQGVIVE